MPACGMRRGLKGAQHGPSSSNTRPKTLARGQASRGGQHKTSSGMASPGRLVRRWRDQGRVPREVLVTQAMAVKTRRAPACVVSLFPLWCKGGKDRPRYQAKATVSVQQDQYQQNGRMEVIVEPKPASSSGSLAGEDQFSQDKCTRCSPSKWPIVGALPAQYLGRGPGPPPINRTSHPRGRGV